MDAERGLYLKSDSGKGPLNAGKHNGISMICKKIRIRMVAMSRRQGQKWHLCFLGSRLANDLQQGQQAILLLPVIHMKDAPLVSPTAHNKVTSCFVAAVRGVTPVYVRQVQDFRNGKTIRQCTVRDAASNDNIAMNSTPQLLPM